MVALSANYNRPGKLPGKSQQFPVAGSVHIFQGSLVMVGSDGYAAPAATVAVGNPIVGVALAEADNSTGAAGDIDCVAQEGVWLFAGTTLGQDDVGRRCYAEDDNTVDETQGTNLEPQVGVIVEYVSSSSAWVRVGLTESLA